MFLVGNVTGCVVADDDIQPVVKFLLWFGVFCGEVEDSTLFFLLTRPKWLRA